MASYPAFSQIGAGSSETWLDDLVIDRAAGGGAKARSFYPARKHAFAFRHVLSTADLATFKAFYDANRLAAVTFAWSGDGATYTCLFDGVPKVQALTANLNQVDVKLTEQ